MNNLPLIEDDTVYKLDCENKKIQIGTVLVGELGSLIGGSTSLDGNIHVQWNSTLSEQRIPAKEVKLMENRCDTGLGVCSLVESDRYGVVNKVETRATCVVLDKNKKEKKYLLNIDANRLKSFTDVNSDLCFYKNAVYEMTDIDYLIELNFENIKNIEITSTRRNFLKRFRLAGDQFNLNFPKDKSIEFKAPFRFHDIIGKLVSIKTSELMKFNNNLKTKELFDLIELSKDDAIENEENDQTVKNDDQTENSENHKSSTSFPERARRNKSKLTNKDKKIQFVVKDIKISEVMMNCVKNFSGNDNDFKTEKISAKDFNQVKLFNLIDRQIDSGSRWKLELTEQDELVDFETYKNYLNQKIKTKINNLPKQDQQDELVDYTVEVNECYEKELNLKLNEQSLDHPVDQLERSIKTELLDSLSSSKIFLDDILDDALDEVFQDAVQDIKSMTKEEIRNSNLVALSRLNRRSRNSTYSRNGSLTLRQSSDRLVNSSFKKIKLGSSSEEPIADIDKLNDRISSTKDLSIEKIDDIEDAKDENNKVVLVDVLYTDKFVEVHWQDNQIEQNVPVGNICEEIDNLINKFYPSNFVDFTGELKEGQTEPTYGVIQKVKQNANLAEVKWFIESISDSNSNDDENNNENNSKSWITYESLFNLRSSCIHFHLDDIVVDQNLITNSSKIDVNDIAKLIGKIRRMHTDGTALIEWIDSSVSKKKLVELVSFFDVEFSDYSDENDDDASSIADDDDDDSDMSVLEDEEDSFDSDKINEKKKKFTEQYKFNRYKFECIQDDQIAFTDQTKEKWLKTIETLYGLIDEFKNLQETHFGIQEYDSQINKDLDKKIIEFAFKLIDCYYEKIKNNITKFDLIETKEKNDFNNLYFELVFSLNNWLDVIQSNYDHLFTLFEEKEESNQQSNKSSTDLKELRKSKKDDKDVKFETKDLYKEFIENLSNDIQEKAVQKSNSHDYRKKIILLINKFNSEVFKRVSLNRNADDDSDELVDMAEVNDNASNVSNHSICSSTPKKQKDTSFISSPTINFKRLDCISIEDNGIKHEFIKSSSKKLMSKLNLQTLQKELNLLRNNLPATGIYVRNFEERLDLLSLMIEGPKNTVYENHLFLFDIKITDLSQEPPECHYLSFGKKQINPNLYLDGNVCLSLLNTFYSKSDQEKWQPKKSSILQLALSLQALVLNGNPFFNEADFDVYCNTQEGTKKAKIYNEFVISSLVDYSIDLMNKRSSLAFKNEIQKYYQTNAFTIYKRYYDFIFISINFGNQLKQLDNHQKLSDKEKGELFNRMVEQEYPQFVIPSYLLLPVSEGFCLSLAKNLKTFVSYFKEHLPGDEIEIMDKQLDDLVSLIQV